MGIWLTICILSHLLAGLLILSALIGLPFISTFFDLHTKSRELLPEMLRISFLPTVELVLALFSIHVPISAVYFAVMCFPSYRFSKS